MVSYFFLSIISDNEQLNYATMSDMRISSPPKTTWREKHSELLTSIQNGRKVTVAIAQGKPLPPPPPATIDPNYVMCTYCGRRFNESVWKLLKKILLIFFKSIN